VEEEEEGREAVSRAEIGLAPVRLEPPMFRSAPPRSGDASPWGAIDGVTPLGPDAVSVTTPSHGGIWVTPAGLERIPQPLRATAYSRGGWFEEDCDWCIPYLVLGLHLFDGDPERQALVLREAKRTLWTYHPEHAELVSGAELAEGQS
jgi:hypothetical protein